MLNNPPPSLDTNHPPPLASSSMESNLETWIKIIILSWSTYLIPINQKRTRKCCCSPTTTNLLPKGKSHSCQHLLNPIYKHRAEIKTFIILKKSCINGKSGNISTIYDTRNHYFHCSIVMIVCWDKMIDLSLWNRKVLPAVQLEPRHCVFLFFCWIMDCNRTRRFGAIWLFWNQ